MSDYGLIVNFLLGIAIKLKKFYDNSTIGILFRKIGHSLNSLINGSDLLKSFYEPGILSEAWKNSIICRFLSWLFILPIKIIGFAWRKADIFLKESLFGKLVSNSIIGRVLIFIVDRFEILLGGSFLIIAAVNHSRWNNFYSTLIVIVLFLLFYLRAIRNKYQDFGIKYLDFSFFAFVFVIIAVQVTGIFPKDSLKFFIFYVTCFLYILIIVASMRTGKALNSMVEIMLMGITITGLYAIFQSIKGVPTDPSLVDMTINEGMPGRAYSTMQNPNSYAQVLILMLPFYAAVFFNAVNVRRKVFLACAAVPVVVALLTTGSRSAWGAFIIAVFIYVFFKEKRLIPLFIVLGLLCIPVLKIVAPSIYLRAMTVFNPNDTSVGFRTLIFETFKPMLNDFWVTGIGLGAGDKNKTFMKLIQNYSLELVDPYGTSGYVPPHTHNLFYQVWIETGIVGIVSFLWMLFRIFRQGIASIYKKCDAKAVNIIIAGISGLAGCLVIGTKEYIWFYPRTMIFFFINIGIIYAGISIAKKKRETFSQN